MEHTFIFKSENGVQSSYWGADTLHETSPAYNALDYANDFVDKFKTYYELVHKRDIPRPRLFVIDNQSVNAFATYDKKLGEYCIGIFYGVFNRILKRSEEIVNMVIEKSRYIPWHNPLIPRDEREHWIKLVNINAIRFFIAHEYAHVLCGHTNGEMTEYMEFVDDISTEGVSMFKQMKEFEADETAMSMLCFLIRCHHETLYRKREAFIGDALHNNSKALKKLGIPEVLINLDAQRFINGLHRAHSERTTGIRQHLKRLMLSVNIVFLVLDENRSSILHRIADQKNIPLEERKTFYFTSGLSLIRYVDHPLAALRLDAVIRIMDEYIEDIEGVDKAEQICKEVADYVWDVEYLRCDRCAEKLYIHIAHTPTAQDFTKELEVMWQQEKGHFNSLLEPMERLFYENRIVDMSDNGVLVFRQQKQMQ